MTTRPRNRVRSFAAMAAGALTLAGCGTTTTIVRPDMLAALSDSAAKDPAGEHQAVTPDGKPVSLTGPMSVSVVVREHGRPPATDTFASGFTATQSGDRVTLRDDQHASSYALADIRQAEIEHTLRNRPGVVLMGVSAAPGIVGGGFLALGVYYLANTGGEGVIEGVGKMFTGIGVGFTVVAVTLLVSGGIVFATSPPPGKIQRPAPALVLGPGGARLRVAF